MNVFMYQNDVYFNLLYLVDVRALYGNDSVTLLLQQGNCLCDCPLAPRGWLKKTIPVLSTLLGLQLKQRC